MFRREFLIKTGKTAGVGVLALSGMNASCDVPSWVVAAEGIASTVVPIAGSILALVAPQLSKLALLVVNGFNAVLKAIQDVQNAITAGSPTDTPLQVLRDVFSALNVDVSNLLQAFRVGGSTDGIISGVIQLIVQAVANLANLFPRPLMSGMKGTMNYLPHANRWKARDFKVHYNELVQNDRRFHPLVVK